MSTNPTPKKKKVVVTASSAGKKSSSRSKTRKPKKKDADFQLYDKRHYRLMLIGIGLIALGLILMSGGGSEDYNTFDADKIYSFRRTVLAPILMVAGLVVEIFMIFKK